MISQKLQNVCQIHYIWARFATFVQWRTDRNVRSRPRITAGPGSRSVRPLAPGLAAPASRLEASERLRTADSIGSRRQCKLRDRYVVGGQRTDSLSNNDLAPA